MKLHASVGADILSSIDFPYPVVPIVRHHHENWDGTGYPDRLQGSQIPIGARILSVVDCFDALTSDRPYRPRLPDSQAIRIILERRGTMYDPLIVDAFIGLHSKLTATHSSMATASSSALAAITAGAGTGSGSPETGLNDITASTEESLILYELTRDLSVRRSVTEVMPLLSRHLRRLMPVTTIVIYVYNADLDELVLAAADGEHAAHLGGLRIPRGQRLSGWVAANKQTILNSDPTLDFGETARSLFPRLRSCLSAPLVAEDRVVGVLTLYSTKELAFLEDHGRIISAVAIQVAKGMAHTGDRDAVQAKPTSLDPPMLLASAERAFSSLSSRSPEISIVLVEIDGVAEGHTRQTDSVGRPLAVVKECIRKTLRSADSVFDFGAGRLLVLLPHAGADEVLAFAGRVQQLVDATESHLPASQRLRLNFGTAVSPTDGEDLASLIERAHSQVVAENRSERPPSVH